MKFIRKTTYYRDTVYEWNLPTGHTCPFADKCLVKVDRYTGKFSNHSSDYRCYSASPERFPAVRSHRWNNFEYVKGGGIPILPKQCRRVRIHASGDFYNQEYFDMWLEIAYKNPDIEFWAYTKSLIYWVKRLSTIPTNFIITASYGGRQDDLITEYSLKHTTVYRLPKDVPCDMPIDRNDDYARMPNVNFALLDNTINTKN